jgi:hypothetical protein
VELTIHDAIARFGVPVEEHLDRQATIPVHEGLQLQGDVAIIPAVMVDGLAPAVTPIPAEGYPVVRGEVGGNTHLLLTDGAAFFDQRSDESGLALGVLTVPDGATAYLAHPEHAYAGIATGTYLLRRQREQADQPRAVSD